jgi:hypothetical protein
MANNSAAYGFVGLKDLFANRVTVVGEETVSTAIEESIAEFQREQAALLQIFVQKVTFAKKRYKLPSGSTLQPLDSGATRCPSSPAAATRWRCQSRAAARPGATTVSPAPR